MQTGRWKLRWKVLGTFALTSIAYSLIVYQPWSAEKQLLRDFKWLSLCSWAEDQNGLARKHFAIGMSRSNAEARLHANGFSSRSRPAEGQTVILGDQYDMVMVGTRSALRIFPLPGREELRLVLYFKQDKIIGVNGYLFGDTI